MTPSTNGAIPLRPALLVVCFACFLQSTLSLRTSDEKLSTSLDGKDHHGTDETSGLSGVDETVPSSDKELTDRAIDVLGGLAHSLMLEQTANHGESPDSRSDNRYPTGAHQCIDSAHCNDGAYSAEGQQELIPDVLADGGASNADKRFLRGLSVATKKSSIPPHGDTSGEGDTSDGDDVFGDNSECGVDCLEGESGEQSDVLSVYGYDSTPKEEEEKGANVSGMQQGEDLAAEDDEEYGGDLVQDKRFMRGLGNGKRFVRGIQDSKRFMRGFGGADKRFMRGLSGDKRFMRGFNADKKFMRGFNADKKFMRGFNADKKFMKGFNADKRFMRGFNADKKFMRGFNSDKRFMKGFNADKRFMRGFVPDKRFLRGLLPEDKRFMHGLVSDKRFMRGFIGDKRLMQNLNEDQRTMEGLEGDKRFMHGLVTDKRFMRGFGTDKRFMRGLVGNKRVREEEEEADKRFMRGFGTNKRFMRGFGTKHKRFLHGMVPSKRFMRGLVPNKKHLFEELRSSRDRTSATDLDQKRFLGGLISGDRSQFNKNLSESPKTFVKSFQERPQSVFGTEGI